MIHKRTHKRHSPDGSLSMSELDRRAAARRDEQDIHTSCAHCDWSFDGPAAEARAAFADHLAAEHPEKQASRRRRRSRAVEREQALAAVSQRAVRRNEQTFRRDILDGEPIVLVPADSGIHLPARDPRPASVGAAVELQDVLAAAGSPGPWRAFCGARGIVSTYSSVFYTRVPCAQCLAAASEIAA